MESISNIFNHNGKPTAVICFAHHTANIKHFNLSLPLILMRRMIKNPSIKFTEIFTYKPELTLFIHPIDFDIVIYCTHLPQDEECNGLYKRLYEYFSEKTIDIFTNIERLIEKYPSAKNEKYDDIFLSTFSDSFSSQVSPIPDPFPSLILPNLFLGPVYFSTDNDFLTEKNIGGIVTVMEESHPLSTQASSMRYHHIQIPDRPHVNIIEHINPCIEFIKKCHEDGLNVYVHCAMGISRSVSFVIAFLMTTMNMSYENAFNFVKQRRPQADPNFGFHCQLLTYEKMLANEEQKN